MPLRDPIVQFAMQDKAVPRELVQLAESDPAAPGAPSRQVVCETFSEAAKAGSAFAMCISSRLAAGGSGRAKSETDAFDFALRAATLDYPPGHYEVGRLLELGIGTPKDLRAAEASYRRAFELGYGLAGHRLGKALLNGDFGQYGIDRAIELLLKADSAGESLAALDLAEIYETDRYGKKDIATSLSWYRRASDLGNPFASMRLSMAYMAGELGLARDANLANHYGELATNQ
jgi:TPR repeat protein